jgi:hypothetical protein
LKALGGLFGQILRLCETAGLVKLGPWAGFKIALAANALARGALCA